MIIDFHTHTFPEAIASRVIDKLSHAAGSAAYIVPTNDALVESMKEAQVDLSILLPVVTATKQTTTINETAVRVNEAYEGRGLFSFGGIHPEDENYKETLKFVKDHGLKGIKLHPVYQKVAFDDPRMMRIVDYASELGLIMQVHAGLDIGVLGDESDPRRLQKTIETVHPERLVLAHFGGWNQFDLVEELLAGENVYFDTAFALHRPYRQIPDGPSIEALPDLCTTEQFVRILNKHGADKILFATDSPWSSQKEQVNVIQSLPISIEQKNMILGDNAKKLLQI